MAKIHGIVGFADYDETSPGVFEPIITEKEFSGDVIRKSNRSVSVSTINDNIVINNQISIIADPYINQHFPSIKYVTWNGNSWKVTSAEPNFPRIILTLGEVYNGKQT